MNIRQSDIFEKTERNGSSTTRNELVTGDADKTTTKDNMTEEAINGYQRCWLHVVYISIECKNSPNSQDQDSKTFDWIWQQLEVGIQKNRIFLQAGVACQNNNARDSPNNEWHKKIYPLLLAGHHGCSLQQCAHNEHLPLHTNPHKSRVDGVASWMPWSCTSEKQCIIIRKCANMIHKSFNGRTMDVSSNYYSCQFPYSSFWSKLCLVFLQLTSKTSFLKLDNNNTCCFIFCFKIIIMLHKLLFELLLCFKRNDDFSEVAHLFCDYSTLFPTCGIKEKVY